MRGTHVQHRPLTPQERQRYQNRYMWDTRDEEPRSEGAYGYDNEAMFRDLEKAERGFEDELVQIGNLKKLLDGERNVTHKLKKAIDDLTLCIGVKEMKDLQPETQTLMDMIHEELWHRGEQT